MTKEFLIAVRALPEEYITDKVAVVEFLGVFVAADPTLPPIMFRSGKWEYIHEQPTKPACAAQPGVVH